MFYIKAFIRGLAIINWFFCVGEKLMTLKQRLQFAMAQRRREERARKAELNRLDNEDCGDEEEEEEMTDESEEEEVTGRLFSRCRSAALYALT